MRGLLRAELLRLRKRRSLQVIVVSVVLLATFFFVASYSSIFVPEPINAAEYRQMLIDEGVVAGLPPDEAEAMLDEIIRNELESYEMMVESQALARAGYVFPYSLVTVLGNVTFVLFALILLTATTIGDEFGWGTIRTSLLASSHRRRLLLTRITGLAATAVLLIGLLVLLGAALPLLLGTSAGRLPPQLPAFSWTAFGVLLAGQLLAALAVVVFAALATLLVRSGALTLVVVLVYTVVEGVILAILLRFEMFQFGGSAEWTLNGFPVRGLFTLLDVAGRAATGLQRYTGDVVPRDLSPTTLPFISLAVFAAISAALAFRRFQRMDIVE